MRILRAKLIPEYFLAWHCMSEDVSYSIIINLGRTANGKRPIFYCQKKWKSYLDNKPTQRTG